MDAWIWWTISISILLKLYNFWTMGRYNGMERLEGKTVVITGANSGSGLEAVKDLAKRGARIIMACRDLKKAEEAKNKIVKETGNSNISVKELDLNSLKSIRTCASKILEEEERIDVLLNNAGVGTNNFSLTPDGLDVMAQTNYFSAFLFTNLLLDKLKKSAPSRIINVSSHLFILGKFDLENLKKPNRSDLMLYYSDTKLALNYFTLELAERLKGTGVTANCLHPGVFLSNIYKRKHPVTFLHMLITKLFFKSCEEGAQTLIYLSVSPEVEKITGKYFFDCKEREMTRKFDVGLSRKLWDFSEEVVGFKSIKNQ